MIQSLEKVIRWSLKIGGRVQLRKSAKNKLLDDLRSIYGDTVRERSHHVSSNMLKLVIFLWSL